MAGSHFTTLLHNLDDKDCAGESQCKGDHQQGSHIEVKRRNQGVCQVEHCHEKQLHHDHVHNSGAPHAGLQQLAGLQLQANGKEQECDADIRKTMENLSAHQLEFVQREAGCEVADKCRQAKGSTAESEDQGDQDN